MLTSVDEDTIVFVFGDHGMTSTGDHGGETEQETNAALLVYSSRPIFNPYQVSPGMILLNHSYLLLTGHLYTCTSVYLKVIVIPYSRVIRRISHISAYSLISAYVFAATNIHC